MKIQFTAAALVAATFAWSPVALAADLSPIRPSKMLTVESATTLPAGANLFSFSGRDLQYYRGLTENIQLEAGTGGLGFYPTLNASLRAQAKASLLNQGMVAVGAGLGGGAAVTPAGLGAPSAYAFLPVSLSPMSGFGVNLVPKVAYGAGLAFGADVGLAAQVAPDFLFIAEDHVADFTAMTHDVLVGGAFTGFGPRTTLAFGVISGNGTPGAPYAAGFGGTLHQGF